MSEKVKTPDKSNLNVTAIHTNSPQELPKSEAFAVAIQKLAIFETMTHKSPNSQGSKPKLSSLSSLLGDKHSENKPRLIIRKPDQADQADPKTSVLTELVRIKPLKSTDNN